MPCRVLRIVWYSILSSSLIDLSMEFFIRRILNDLSEMVCSSVKSVNWSNKPDGIAPSFGLIVAMIQNESSF